MKKQLLLIIILCFIGYVSSYASIGDKYEAEAFDSASGAKAEVNASASGGGNVGYIQNGTYIGFNSIHFDGNEEWIEVSTSSDGSGGNIEFRIDSVDGTLIATAEVPVNGSWSDYQIRDSAMLSAPVTGDKALFLIFTGGSSYLFNIDYFVLNAVVPDYTLTTGVSPANSGTVTANPAGPVYSQGTDVELTATKNLGYEFDHWEDGNATNISSDNPLTVDISQDTTLTAVFTAVDILSLYIGIDTGSVIVSLKTDSVSISGDSLYYNTGSSIPLVAVPAFGYEFSHWENAAGTEISTENPDTILLSSDSSAIAVTEAITEYKLPSWTFDNEYGTYDADSIDYYTASTLDMSDYPTVSPDAWIYPNNKTMGSSIGLTADVDELVMDETGGNDICRISFTDSNTVSDFTDTSLHNQFYQFTFPTTGYKNIGLDFKFSGGQNNASDYLELVYSVDKGATWVDGGKFNAEDHWNKWVNPTPSLANANNKDLVIVRLIGITETNGASRNFNLDWFTVTGDTIAPLPEGVIAYWKLDGNAIDELGTSNGTIHNDGDSLWTTGAEGQAIDFSKGVDSAYIGVDDNDIVDFDSTESFTISALINIETVNQSSDINIVFKGATGVTANGGEGKWYTFAIKDNELRFAVDDSTDKTQLGVNVASLLPTDEWAHVVAVRDLAKDSLFLYINGLEIGQKLDATERNIASSLPLIIGNNQNQNHQFDGMIDELMMYDKALTAEEIANITVSFGLDILVLSSNNNLSDLQVNDTTVTGFSPATLSYDIELAAGTTAIPVVTATAADSTAKVVIAETDTLPGTTTITVTAQNGDTKAYTVNFTVKPVNVVSELSSYFNAYFNSKNNELIIENAESINLIEIYNLSGMKVCTINNNINSVMNLDKYQLQNNALYIIRLANTITNEQIIFKTIK